MDCRLLHTCTGHNGALYALQPGFEPHTFLSAGSDGWIVQWDLHAPEFGKLLATVTTQVFSLCRLPNQQKLVAGNMDGGLHWVDLIDPAQTLNVLHHKKGVFDLLAVGDYLYSVGGDGVLTRWSTETQRAVESYQLSNQALRTLAYAPTRKELAIGASDGNIYLLDAETLAFRYTIQQAHAPSVFTVQYSPDAHLLFSGGRDAMLRVWEVSNIPAPLHAVPAHLFTLNHLVFSPDGRFFATASRDKTLKIWDTASLQLLKVVDVLRLDGHINSVNRLLWLEEGLISCGDDRVVKIWGF
jgi:WD40 repeat protein